jgi:hypothetical protein
MGKIFEIWQAQYGKKMQAGRKRKNKMRIKDVSL